MDEGGDIEGEERVRDRVDNGGEDKRISSCSENEDLVGNPSRSPSEMSDVELGRITDGTDGKPLAWLLEHPGIPISDRAWAVLLAGTGLFAGLLGMALSLSLCV